jgi:chaperonin GroES
MVGPINEAVNTMINLLTDAGHMSTLQGGFLSRGIRMKGGAVKFKPGEWKQINTTGDDLKKGVFPIPVRDPSAVLFQLLGLLIDSGKDLTSVQDIMVGRNPGQNQPFSTSQEVISQGMKVFNGIYKRLYRSMTSEFKKLYALNREHPNIELYKNVLDMEGEDAEQAEQVFGPQEVLQFLAADFKSDDIDIIPTAEPDMVAEMEKIAKSNALLQMKGAGIPLNHQEVTKRMLESQGHEDIQLLMKVPPPQDPPDIVVKKMQLQQKDKIDTLNVQLKDLETRSKVLLNQAQAELAFAQAQGLPVKDLHEQFVQQQGLINKEFELVTARLKVLSDDRDKKQARAAGAQAAAPAGESK